MYPAMRGGWAPVFAPVAGASGKRSVMQRRSYRELPACPWLSPACTRGGAGPSPSSLRQSPSRASTSWTRRSSLPAPKMSSIALRAKANDGLGHCSVQSQLALDRLQPPGYEGTCVERAGRRSEPGAATRPGQSQTLCRASESERPANTGRSRARALPPAHQSVWSSHQRSREAGG
jgi:hypothetical protein